MSAIAAEIGLAPAAADAACEHCGGAVAIGSASSFCCQGCATAHAMIRGLGLDQYYLRRQLDPARRAPRPEAIEADLAAHVVTDDQGVSMLAALIDGLHCAACVWLIESVLARQPGVIVGRVNMTTHRLTLRWRGGAERVGALVGAIAQLGYRPVPVPAASAASPREVAERELLRCLAVAGFAAANVMLLSVSVWAGHVGEMGIATRQFMHWLSALIALPAIAYAGRPFFRSALAALAGGRANMDVPISIGVILAAGMSLFETAQSGPHAYFDSAITLLFFLLIGRFLDLRARGRAWATAELIARLRAQDATLVLADGTLRRLPADRVRPGDVILAAAGERIAADGRVVDGESTLDLSAVTGESAPAPVGPGVAVFAGTINLGVPLRIAVSAAGEGTLLADIQRWMEAAERGRGRFVALADRVARRYAPVVHLTSLLTFIGWIAFGGVPWHAALLIAVTVLIITCPCALALAVPAAQVSATSRLLRGGILLKSATALERIASIDMVIFDKTGTLTLGRPELLPDPKRGAADLRLAAGMAAASRHPLAQALARADGRAAALTGLIEVPGQGLRLATDTGDIRLGSRRFCGIVASEGGDEASEMWLAGPGRQPLRFAFADALRPDAAATVAAIKAMGLKIELLSGDRRAIAARLAAELGIDAWQAEIDPIGKGRRLAELGAAGHRVLMVGDGINDAPALASAYVSMSPATAADVSQVAADAVFQGDRLGPVVELIALARRSQRVARENLALALLYNAFAVPLAIAGMVTPLIAALAMSSSSLLVIGNALRLGRGGAR